MKISTNGFYSPRITCNIATFLNNKDLASLSSTSKTSNQFIRSPRDTKATKFYQILIKERFLPLFKSQASAAHTCIKHLGTPSLAMVLHSENNPKPYVDHWNARLCSLMHTQLADLTDTKRIKTFTQKI